MAQIREVRLIDDLDGEQAVETIEFGVDGRNYEIDLSDANATRLRDALALYVASARRTTASTRRRAASAPAGGGVVRRPTVDREQNQAIREWARKRDLKISDRGRIPSEVLEAYHREH